LVYFFEPPEKNHQQKSEKPDASNYHAPKHNIETSVLPP
jgi:hypothetical protein